MSRSGIPDLALRSKESPFGHVFNRRFVGFVPGSLSWHSSLARLIDVGWFMGSRHSLQIVSTRVESSAFGRRREDFVSCLPCPFGPHALQQFEHLPPMWAADGSAIGR